MTTKEAAEKAQGELNSFCDERYFTTFKQACQELGHPVVSDEHLGTFVKIATKLNELEQETAPVVKKASEDAASDALSALMAVSKDDLIGG